MRGLSPKQIDLVLFVSVVCFTQSLLYFSYFLGRSFELCLINCHLNLLYWLLSLLFRGYQLLHHCVVVIFRVFFVFYL